jgi:hypothetical protein
LRYEQNMMSCNRSFSIKRTNNPYTLYFKSARYEDGWRFCTVCQLFFKERERCPTHGIPLPRKKSTDAYNKPLNNDKNIGCRSFSLTDG